MNLGGNGFSIGDYVDISVSPGSKVDDFLSIFGIGADKQKPPPAPTSTNTTIMKQTAPLFDRKLLIGGAVVGAGLLLFIAMRQK